MKTLACSALALALLSAPAHPAAAQDGWEATLGALLATEPGETRETLLRAVLEAETEWAAVAAALRAKTPAAPAKTGLVLRTNPCSDGVERPYALFIPEGYEPGTATPLLVALHGGVSRADLFDDPLALAADSEYLALAKERGMLAIWPMGQRGATWWDELGIENVRAQIHSVKRDFHVDDDRVFVIGYSDGASAAFAWAMTMPSTFGVFVALSGHMGVGSEAGGMATFPSNLVNTPIYAVTSFDDSLYPSKKMRATIELALKAGGDVYYREQEGPHDFSYAEEEMPLVARFLDRHPRDPHPARISWETTGPEKGRCHWLRLDSIAPEAKAAVWHGESNMEMTSDRITIGFRHDSEHAGSGMRIETVLEESFAAEVGLRPDDVLVRADEIEVEVRADLSRWKSGVSRGDEVQFEVIRGEDHVVLDGALPPAETYPLFVGDAVSGRARALFSGNRVDIETSRVGSLSVLIDPAMFRLERDVTVTLNGKQVFQGRVEPDLELMLRHFLADRDRRFLPVAELRFDL